MIEEKDLATGAVEFSPLSSQNYVASLSERGKDLIPPFLINQVEDEGNGTIKLRIYVVDNLENSYYTSLVNNKKGEILEVNHLNSKGEGVYKVLYEDLKFEDFYFNRVGWMDDEDEDSVLYLHIEYSYGDKKLQSIE